MKNILKFAVIFLLLFAMIGTASAAIDPSSVVVGPRALNADGVNYDFTVEWTGTDDGEITISITPGSISKNFSFSSSPVTLSEPLTPGETYTVVVSDDSGTSDSTTFNTPAYLADPSITDLQSLDSSTGSSFDLSWTWTSISGETLQIYDGTNWINTTGNTETIPGTSTLNKNVIFRTISSDSYSNNTTPQTFKFVIFESNSNTSNSITWILSNDWPKYANYSVSGSSTGAVPSSDLDYVESDRKLVASNLNPGEDYTLTIRGFDDPASSGIGYSLYRTSAPVSLAAIVIIDKSEMSDFFNSDGTPKALSIENATQFNLKAVTSVDSSFKWELNKTSGFTNITKNNVSSAKEDTFSWKPDLLGDYTLELTVTDGTNPAETITWPITVTEKSTGSRIWKDGMPTTYTWDSRSFSGFYYDLDTGQGQEEMKITGIGRSLGVRSITYNTTSSSTDYAYSGWGSYEIIGFMGDKYYAGSGSDSLASNGNLSKVLIDENEKIQLQTGQSYALDEGYSIRIDQINTQGSSALIVLEKDGRVIDQSIVRAPDTYTYKKDVGNAKNIEFVKVRVQSVFQGTESSIVELGAVFQISDKLTRLERGSKIDRMEIKDIRSTGGKVVIEMENHESISLNQDSNVTLMGKVILQVADSSTLKFAPTMVYTDPGVYEIRGTVSDFGSSNEVYEWTPLNFEGFYYDINDDDLTNFESIEIRTTANTNLSNTNRSIAKDDLVYSAKVSEVSYNYTPWGKYDVIGFMGEKYYAGVNGNLLKSGNMSKVLMDSDDKRQMYVGQSFALEDGVSVVINQIDVNGNAAQLSIEKNGKNLFNGIVRAGDSLNYSKRIGNDNVTFVRIYVNSVFMGTESSIIEIGGVFQASEDLTKVERGAKYGRMEVDSVSASGIELSNTDRLTLSSGNEVEFMKVGNQSMYFKVGDSSTLRFAPVVEREIGSTDPLEVRVEPSTATVGDTVKITVNDRGATIEGVTVSVNGSTIGTTNGDGVLNYTANSIGTIRILAEKSGYTNGTATLVVNERLGNMTVRVSPDTIHFGETGTIRVTDSMNGSAISGASITVGSNSVGTTDSNGQLEYSFNATGNITVMASKDKYNNASTSVSISQRVAFVYSNFEMKPIEPAAKGNTKISFDVTNNGVESGSHEVKLTVTDSNGNVVDTDSKNVSVDVGKTKSVTLSFKAPAEGNYRVTLQEADSNRVVDLPSNIANVSVGPAKTFVSTLIYIVLAIIAIIVLAVIGFVAYLFGVKGATTSNYKEVASEVAGDIKSKFKK